MQAVKENTRTMSQGNALFTMGEAEKLVEIVSKFPCIYDVSSPLYKDNTWREIAEFVERSVEGCKKRCRNIKYTYKQRQNKRKITGSSASSKEKKCPLADMLTFLNKVDHKRESTVYPTFRVNKPIVKKRIVRR